MCLSSIIAGAVFVAVFSLVGTWWMQQEDTTFRFKLSGDVAGAFAGGGTCGGVCIPLAIVAASPAGGILALILGIAFGAVSGPFVWERVAARAVATGIGFGMSAAVFGLLWVVGGGALIELAAQAMPTILSNFGVQC